MLIELLTALILGIIGGAITGLIPGIHINLVALLLFVLSPFLLGFSSPIILAVFIVSMSTVHIFVDFIPSIFLGAPEETTILTVLPGHRMLLEGEGYQAVKLSVTGSYIGLISLFFLVPLFLLFLSHFYNTFSFTIPFVLIIASIWIIAHEKNKLIALIIFYASGILGIISLNSVITEPLLPLLTGFFGASALIKSISDKTIIPLQKITAKGIDKKEITNTLLPGWFASSLCAFLPAFGASQAAFLGSQLKKVTEKEFLILIGMISTIVTGLNFASLYLINKSRSGTGVIIQKLLGEIAIKELWLFLAVMLISGSIAVLISLFFAKIFAKNISKISYSKINITVLLFLVGLCLAISGPYSILVLLVSTSLGILAIETGIKRINLMGCLIIPVILYFFL